MNVTTGVKASAKFANVFQHKMSRRFGKFVLTYQVHPDDQPSEILGSVQLRHSQVLHGR